MTNTYDHDACFAAVAAREDVDGSCPTVIYTPDRGADDPIFIELSPKDARALARALNKAARRLA